MSKGRSYIKEFLISILNSAFLTKLLDKFVPFLLTIVLPVLLRFMDSDYPFVCSNLLRLHELNMDSNDVIKHHNTIICETQQNKNSNLQSDYNY